MLYVILSQQDAEQLGRLPGADGLLVRDTILSPTALAAGQSET